jgi:hypothetical protein
LRGQPPDQERPFRVPGGDLLPYLAFLASGLLPTHTQIQVALENHLQS